MLEILLQQNVFVYVMTGFCLVGVIHKLLLGRYYKRMVYAAENMGLSNKKALKSIKTKFENSFKLDMNVTDVNAFVDKNLSKQKICGISLNIWDKLNYQITAICILLGMAGAFYGIFKNHEIKNIATTFLYGLFTGVVLLFFEASVGTDQKRQALRTNIKDYLQNYLLHRISGGKPESVAAPVVEKIETKDGESVIDRTMEDDMEYLKTCLNEIASARNLEKQEISGKEEEILEDILRDFFM